MRLPVRNRERGDVCILTEGIVIENSEKQKEKEKIINGSESKKVGKGREKKASIEKKNLKE